jgi:O-antigen/teichoic acid export membrane protein
MTQPTTLPRDRGSASHLFDVFFASFGFLILRFILGPVRIKLLTSLLGKEDYGTLTLISVTLSVIVLVSSLGSLEFLLLKLPGRDRPYRQSRLKTVMLLFGGVAMAIAVAGVPVLAFWPGGALGLSPADVAICGLLLVLSAHLNHRSYYLLGTMDFSRSRITQLLFADLWFVPVLFFLGRGSITISQMLWVWAGWYVLTMGVTHRWVTMGEMRRVSASREAAVEVLGFGLPLVPMIVGDLLTRVQDRYVLLAFTDIGTVATYALAIGIAMIGVQVGDAALDLLVTEFFRVRNRIPSQALDDLAGDPALRLRFTVMVRYCLVIAAGVGFAQVWLAEPIVRFMSSPEFLDAARFLPWLAPIAAIYQVFIVFSKVFIALNRGKELGWAAFAAAFLSLGSNLALIPLLGGRGAALAAVISMSALTMYLGIRIRCLRWVDWPALRPGRLAALLGAACAAFALVATWPAGAFVKLLAGGGAYFALVCLLGLLTRDDLALFRDARTDVAPDVLAASDERDTL